MAQPKEFVSLGSNNPGDSMNSALNAEAVRNAAHLDQLIFEGGFCWSAPDIRRSACWDVGGSPPFHRPSVVIPPPIPKLGAHYAPSRGATNAYANVTPRVLGRFAPGALGGAWTAAQQRGAMWRGEIGACLTPAIVRLLRWTSDISINRLG